MYLLDEPYEVDNSVKWARYYDWVFTVDRATVDIHGAAFTDRPYVMWL